MTKKPRAKSARKPPGKYARTKPAARSKTPARAKPKAPASRKPAARSAAKPGKPPATDPLDRLVDAAADALGLPLDPAWRPAVKGNLAVTLQHAALVTAFALPDEAEPAPVFEA